MKAIYKAVDIARLGLRSLALHKARSGLSALGILFAVWSVIAMLAVSEGLSHESQLSLREMGSSNIIIRSVKPPLDSGASAQSSGVLAYGLTRQDVGSLLGNLPHIVRSATVHQTLRYAYLRGKNVMVTAIGTEPSYGRVVRIDMKAGRFITHVDLLRHKPHCVITQSLARRLFAYEDSLGKSILVGGEPLIVVGVLSRLPRTLSEGVSDPDSCVILPLTTDYSRLGEFNVMWQQGGMVIEKVEINQLILQMTDEKAVVEGASIGRSLLKRHHEQQDYEVKVPLELLAQMKKQMWLWNVLFVMVACVSLLVGGIGIMNIMLASVTERTREIGVRRAMGAKRTDIVVQFLVESVTLTTVGGAVGIAVGVLVPSAVERLLEFKTIVSPSTLLLPFIMAVAVGLASGLYPAFRAAKLDPIIALRHE